MNCGLPRNVPPSCAATSHNQRGLYNTARATATTSTNPSATADSAILASVIRPTPMVGMPVAALTICANGNWKPGAAGIFCRGETPAVEMCAKSAPAD